MTIVAEVRDGVTLVAEGIGSIRTIYGAIKDGREYIDRLHPDVKGDLVVMCIEMRKTLTAVATASAIITHFRFTVAGNAKESDPARFNDHLLRNKSDAMDVEDQLNALRGHCGIIKAHADNLDDKAKKAGMRSLFGLIGVDSKKREHQLVQALNRIYDDEMEFHHNVYGMRQTLHKALDVIGNELGPSGAMDPQNVPKAAAALGEYAEVFGKLESDANHAALQLQKLITGIDKGIAGRAN